MKPAPQNIARYRNTLTDNEFENGGWSSMEIHASTDQRAIGDAGVAQWRQARLVQKFQGEIWNSEPYFNKPALTRYTDGGRSTPALPIAAGTADRRRQKRRDCRTGATAV